LVFPFFGAPALERASQDFYIFARDMKSFGGVDEFHCACGTDGGGEAEDLVDVDDGGFADAEEVVGEDGFEFVDAVADAVDVVGGVGVDDGAVGFVEEDS